MFDFKNSFLEFWRKITAMFSRLAGVFGFKSKAKKTQSTAPKTFKVPKVKTTPAIKKETAMEFNVDPDKYNVAQILEESENIVKKTYAPEPPTEPVSKEDAKNIAKMLPILMALGMAKAGPEEGAKEFKDIEGSKESMEYFMPAKEKSAEEYMNEPMDMGEEKNRGNKWGGFAAKEQKRKSRSNSRRK
jgi:hypothetical protein